MGYFPLPELKGKPNRIFVDGKTLNQIAKESGIRLDTVQHRYSRGIRDYEGLTKPSHIRVEHEKTQRKTYSIMSAGERVMERMPSNKADVIVCDELLADRKNGDFDTLAVLSIQRSNGEKVEVNRYFKEGEKSFIEISPEEYEERKKMHEKRQEQEAKAQDEN